MGYPDSVMPPSDDPKRSKQRGVVRILVVDDDPRVRNAIAQTVALEADLIMVAEAPAAVTAPSMAEDMMPSVALVDLALPDSAPGLSLVRTLTPHAGCAVVAMSIPGGLRPHALMAGAALFVEKDGSIDAVLTAVRSAFTSTIRLLRRAMTSQARPSLTASSSWPWPWSSRARSAWLVGRVRSRASTPRMSPATFRRHEMTNILVAIAAHGSTIPSPLTISIAIAAVAYLLWSRAQGRPLTVWRMIVLPAVLAAPRLAPSGRA